MFFIDPLYMTVLIVSLVIAGGSQLYISSTFKKWGNVKNGDDLDGQGTAKVLIDKFDLGINEINHQKGKLTDFYNPKDHSISLSDSTYAQNSVASMAVTAHELGHAQQHKEESPLIGMRNFLIPALTVSPQLSYGLILIGLLFSLPGFFKLGIIFYAIIVLFSVITVPVEFNASKRGLKMLDEAGLFKTEEDRKGSKHMLNAAGLTYVAAAVTALLQLFYYIAIARR